MNTFLVSNEYTNKIFIKKYPTIFLGSLILFLMVLIAVFASELTNDPMKLNPIKRLKPPGNGNLVWN